MAHQLCTNCGKKFDGEKSYALREVTVPAYLTKSGHEEALSFRRPVCPQCGAENTLLSMAAMRTKNSAELQIPEML